jgi:hypothetical protein
MLFLKAASIFVWGVLGDVKFRDAFWRSIDTYKDIEEVEKELERPQAGPLLLKYCSALCGLWWMVCRVGGPILRIRSSRAMWQLYLEVLFLPLAIPMILGMALWPLTIHYDEDTQSILAITPLILGIAGGLYLRLFHNGLTKKWIKSYTSKTYLSWRGRLGAIHASCAS